MQRIFYYWRIIKLVYLIVFKVIIFNFIENKKGKNLEIGDYYKEF